MDQFQVLNYLQASLNTNATYTFSCFFLLWVSFRLASRVREFGGTAFAKISCTLFGLLVVWTGLTLFASRTYILATTAKGLRDLKAAGQSLGAQAEGFLSSPFAPASGMEPNFNLLGDPLGALFWLVSAVILMAVIWMPTKKSS